MLELVSRGVYQILRLPLLLTTMSAASAGSKVAFEPEGLGIGEAVQRPAEDVLLSGSNPMRRISCTKETTECFSGTLHNLFERRSRLRIAASTPDTGLRWI